MIPIDFEPFLSRKDIEAHEGAYDAHRLVMLDLLTRSAEDLLRSCSHRDARAVLAGWLDSVTAYRAELEVMQELAQEAEGRLLLITAALDAAEKGPARRAG